MNSIDPVLLAAAYAIVALSVISTPILLLMIARRAKRMLGVSENFKAGLTAIDEIKKKVDEQAKALASLNATAANHYDQAKATHEALADASKSLSSYGSLAVSANDLFSAIEHFEDRIRDGASMAENLRDAIAGLQETIKAGGRAAADVNGIMAEMRRDLKALADSHKEMLETLQQQQVAFKKILGAVKVQVSVELSHDVTSALNNAAEQLRAAAKVISGLEEPLKRLTDPKPPRGLLARIFSPD